MLWMDAGMRLDKAGQSQIKGSELWQRYSTAVLALLWAEGVGNLSALGGPELLAANISMANVLPC